MKKFFVSFGLAFLLPTAVFAAYVPGMYTARLNLNIRALPSVQGSLLSHYEKGDTVQVTKVLGSWCAVTSQYPKSYVYCPFLVPVNSTSVGGQLNNAGSGIISRQLQSLQNWLLNNNVGVNYINNSFFQARNLAQNWDSTSQISYFSFGWPLQAGPKCSMDFKGQKQPAVVFVANCFDASGKLATSQGPVTDSYQGYNVPQLLFKDYIAQMLADASVMNSLNGYFGTSPSITVLFRLYKDSSGIQLWSGEFMDAQHRYMMVSADAENKKASFRVSQGSF